MTHDKLEVAWIILYKCFNFQRLYLCFFIVSMFPWKKHWIISFYLHIVFGYLQVTFQEVWEVLKELQNFFIIECYDGSKMFYTMLSHKYYPSMDKFYC